MRAILPGALVTKDLMTAEPGSSGRGPGAVDCVPDYESTFPEINEGEVVHGTVVRVDKDEVLVDIGYKSEGVIPVAELCDPAVRTRLTRSRSEAESTRSC